jgi:hypothetical protein
MSDVLTPAERAWQEEAEAVMAAQERYDRLVYLAALGRYAVRDKHGLYDEPDVGGRSIADVAEAMRNPRPPAMLLDGWLVAGALHWMFAEPGGAKTWTALQLARQVAEAGDVVLWVDEELGEHALAERLLALGVSPETVERNFVFFCDPAWLRQADAREDRARWDALVARVKPALVVVDTATDALSVAGMDENSGVEVTRWIKNFCEPARRRGSAVLVLDHVPKSGESRGYAIGSRAKKAKAKVQYELKTLRPFDRDSVGLVRVNRVKNSLGARIDATRTFRVGGEVDALDRETFVFEPANAADEAAATAGGAAALRQRIRPVLREHGPLSVSQVRAMVTGGAAAIAAELAEMVEDGNEPVSARREGRSVLYRWDGLAAVSEEEEA